MRNDINARIAQCRKMAGFTQNEAAQSLGIKRNTYARMELKGNPKPEMLKELAALYNVSTDMILYGEENSLVQELHVENERVLPMAHQNQSPSIFADSIPFIPTGKEENIIKIIRNLPKEKKDAVLQFIETQYKSSKE